MANNARTGEWMAATQIGQESVENQFRDGLAKILTGYQAATEAEKPNQSSFRQAFNAVVSVLRENPTLTSWGKPFKVTFGIGRYNKWANVPWIAVLNDKVTSSVQRGVFVVYLFREDMSGLYVSLNQGATEAIEAEDAAPRKVKLRLRLRAHRYREALSWLEPYGFDLTDNISLRSTSTTGELYEAGSIAHRFYPADDLPSDGILLHELQPLLKAYDQVAEKYFSSGRRPTNQQWCVYVTHSTADNFAIAEREGVWGTGVADRFVGINKGDEILFVQDLRAETEPAPRGFPRVQLEDFRGIAARVVKGIVVSPVYSDTAELWPDAVYPHRFRFEVEDVSEQVPINAEGFPPEVLDAIRRSAATGGRPQLVGPLVERERDDDPEPQWESVVSPVLEPYDLEDALNGLFLEPNSVQDMLTSFHRKKNLILEGPPGVGKTFVARRLAYLLMEQKDDSRVQFLQFHQSYSYEDFVQGWRPKAEGGFQRVDGVFLDFCGRARKDSRPHVFVIDEINRGNTSKIFGELFMLLEADKRSPDFEVPLVYSSKTEPAFFIPPNVYVLGLMNTADRSLAMVDYALRRRFAFGTLSPAFEHPTFVEHLARRGISQPMIARIVDRMTALNREIASDKKNLGPGFQIGHSFFCERDADGIDESDWYRLIVEFEVAPLLREYYFDDDETATALIEELLA